jgi:hypothetical protein
MRLYRCHLYDGQGYLAGMHMRECVDDAASREWLEELLHKHLDCLRAEIWQFGRMVARRSRLTFAADET